MARYLISEFSTESFEYLDRIAGRGRYKEIEIEISDVSSMDLSQPLHEAVRLGLATDFLTLKGAQVFSSRRGEKFSIYDLSSGEYQILTTLLALGFSVKDGSIVLVDEPENSLHPQWQQEFMTTLSEIFGRMSDGHSVISTHSPIIVASAPIGANVIDLSIPVESLQADTIPFGLSTDSILFEQFGIASSRNPQVVDIVQRAVALAERGEAAGSDFHKMKAQLSKLHSTLRREDPLRDVAGALLEGGE